MNTYAIQWRGTITRDVGVEEITAVDAAAAKAAFNRLHGINREIVAISLVCEE